METNRHHVWYPRHSYKTPIEKTLRLHPAFVVLGSAQRHRELHANVIEPPKLSSEVTSHLLDHIGTPEIGGIAGLESAIGFFRDMQESPRLVVADLSHLAYEALSQQLYYLKGSREQAA